MTKEDAEKILRYLREPQFVLVEMPHDESKFTHVVNTESFVTSKNTFTVVYVPEYGAIHIEAFMKECKELGLDV